MRCAVLGGGSWGTALALQARRAGHPTRLWVRDAGLAETIRRERGNPAYLPGVTLPEGIAASADLAQVVTGAQAVLVAIPSAYCRALFRSLAPSLPAGATLVSATKGLEIATLQRMSQVAAEELPGFPLAVLSGPSFAAEVAREQPTAVVVASAHAGSAEGLQQALSTRTFRVYASEDVVGVELAGALKNVIAIAAGILDGLGYGHNTLAALITRGLAETARLAVALGGRPDTLSGLAGLGDLVLTCTGGLSRNRRLGQALGRGRPLAEAVAGLAEGGAAHMVAEGVGTTLAACDLAERAGVEMPIAQQMREVLHRGRAPRDAVDALMLRSLKRE